MANPDSLQRIHRPALKIALNALNLNRNYPRAVAVAGPKYFGLDLNDFAASQGMVQLDMYVGHFRCQDQTGDLLLIEKDYIELIVGTGVCPLDHSESVAVDYVEQTWIVTLAAFLQRCCGSILTNTKRVVELQRENDVYLMAFTEDMSKSKRAVIQRCRLYLQVATLADVSDITGTRLDRRVYLGKRN